MLWDARSYCQCVSKQKFPSIAQPLLDEWPLCVHEEEGNNKVFCAGCSLDKRRTEAYLNKQSQTSEEDLNATKDFLRVTYTQYLIVQLAITLKPLSCHVWGCKNKTIGLA